MPNASLHQHAVRLLMALALGAAAAGASAHDTWFQTLPETARGERVLALGSGPHYPGQDSGVGMRQLHSHGCRGRGLPVARLRWVADQPTALVLRTALPVPAGSALTCWAQLVPIDIELDHALVDVYLDEVRATAALRERWAALKARGLPWRETFVKHARIELPADAAATSAAAGAAGTAGTEAPTAAIDGLGMDVRVETPGPLRAGDTLRAQVLRDGQPLVGLAVELRSDVSPLGLWRQTDEQGRIDVVLPLAANWLLRGVDLRPPTADDGRWQSRFISLGLQVLPRR